jgi:hypothetical protein
MQVNLPKNLFIKEAEVGFFKGGLYDGAYGLTLTFSGQDFDSTDILAEVIYPITKLQFPQRKLVRLQGLFPVKSPLMKVFLQTLKSWGFTIHLIVDHNQLELASVPLVDWLILRTTKPFIPIVSSELWYLPLLQEREGDDAAQEGLVDPIIPQPEKTLLYLEKSGYSMGALTKFVVSSKYNWLLL